jgi:hypothetical protein
MSPADFAGAREATRLRLTDHIGSGQKCSISQEIEFVERNGSTNEWNLYTDGVGGSSPSPPTSLRSLRELRLGKPSADLSGEASKAAAP